MMTCLSQVLPRYLLLPDYPRSQHLFPCYSVKLSHFCDQYFQVLIKRTKSLPPTSMKCFAAKPERGAREEFFSSITIYFFKKTVFIGYTVCLHRVLVMTIVSSLFKIHILQELL